MGKRLTPAERKKREKAKLSKVKKQTVKKQKRVQAKARVRIGINKRKEQRFAKKQNKVLAKVEKKKKVAYKKAKKTLTKRVREIKRRDSRIAKITGRYNKALARDSKRAILVKSGRLRRSIFMSVESSQRIKVVNPTPYGVYHNYGNPKRNLPKRQFMGKSKNLDYKAGQRISKMIKGALR